ncbi:YtxH domain-containing protein [Mahella australiensis]|uniref:YtxH domain-containing protein n=1 Tax=Mahella australiensis (strain DSM 15567 / CIP 107919 / 50-1 BON) TaxID=697281 RepID=F4A1K2_MAHA5|nr:YtxH domain-containing protein [Mahella australiensis]AEE96036.1 hypothetical protein Mahau_0838 [Mahella australiensis 50-1 BON]
MGNKYFRGFMMGAMIGVAAGMVILPQLNASTRKRIAQTSRKMVNKAGDTVGDMMDME